MVKQLSNLGSVEKKVYGALLSLSNDKMEVVATNDKIAHQMGYKRSGGALTFALKMLEMKNRIEILPKNKYRVFL